MKTDDMFSLKEKVAIVTGAAGLIGEAYGKALASSGANVILCDLKGTKKFSRKYQSDLEEKKKPYEIQNHISDIVGLRIVCLYEKDVERIRKLICLRIFTSCFNL